MVAYPSNVAIKTGQGEAYQKERISKAPPLFGIARVCRPVRKSERHPLRAPLSEELNAKRRTAGTRPRRDQPRRSSRRDVSFAVASSRADVQPALCRPKPTTSGTKRPCTAAMQAEVALD